MVELAPAQEFFYQSVTRIGEPPPDQWSGFQAQFFLKQVPKSTPLLLAGEHSKKVWFVAEGLVRLYYAREDGKIFNKGFVKPGVFVGALESLLTGVASRLYIEALTDCTLLESNYAALTSLYSRDPFWERLGRVIAETLYVRKARREAALLMDSAAARYEEFLSEMGDLEPLIPNYHIASYLGITPEALSRIRRARVT